MATKTKSNKKDEEDNSVSMLNELVLIRQLLMLLLAKLGSDSTEIGNAIGVAPSTVRGWLSFSKVNKIVENKSKGEK